MISSVPEFWNPEFDREWTNINISLPRNTTLF